MLLASAPAVDGWNHTDIEGGVSIEDVAGCLSTAVRAHVLGGPPPPEHRQVCVAFLHFDGTDEMLATQGPEVLADGLQELAARPSGGRRDGICFLASDVDADGGKLILTAAPRIGGDGEERMLLALRAIVEAPAIPFRIGVNGGRYSRATSGRATAARTR